MSQKPIKLAIIGAGPGGLALAISLLSTSKQFDIRIYEAIPAPVFQGTGLGFYRNGTRAMDLLHPEIRRVYEQFATHNGWPEKEKEWFCFRLGMRLPMRASQATSDPVGSEEAEMENGEGAGDVLVGSVMADVSAVLRDSFLGGLRGLLPAELISWGKRVVGIQELGVQAQDGIELTFTDQIREVVDVVVGCDGIRSAVRNFVLGEEAEALKPVFTGKCAFRGLVSKADVVEILGEERGENRGMFLGKGGHVIIFPVEGGKTVNVVAFRDMTGQEWEHEQWLVPTEKDAMLSQFAGWNGKIRRVLEASGEPFFT
jgi:salicylate hydroxylase